MELIDVGFAIAFSGRKIGELDHVAHCRTPSMIARMPKP
jgi:hypothetical protein